VRCWIAEVASAAIGPILQKMLVMVLTSEASYHAPYDHCTVKYLVQAGVQPTHIKLVDLGIHGKQPRHDEREQQQKRSPARSQRGWTRRLPGKE